MQKLQASKENVRAFKRFLFGSAAELDLINRENSDSGYIAEYAHLVKDVIVLGTGDKIEIWSKEAYAAYSEKTVPAMEAIAETLEGFGDLEF